jgi:hypothetical protein
MPLNSSLLIIKNDMQLESIKKELIKIKIREEPLDEIVFLIGFYEKNGFDFEYHF